jgi:hypothetical protein
MVSCGRRTPSPTPMPFLTSPKHPASRLFTTLGGAENPLDDGTIHARSCAEHAAKIKKGSRIFIFTEPHTATRWRGLKFPPALNLLIFQILGGVGDTFAAGKRSDFLPAEFLYAGNGTPARRSADAYAPPSIDVEFCGLSRMDQSEEPARAVPVR